MPPRLPGLAFDIVAPPRLPGLPSMDVALFAGFAARGPCHRALILDSAQAFADTFGGDLTLARDDRRGITLLAQLGAAVAGFFANGGNRCQVIRLARTPALAARWGATLPDPDAAEAALFPLTGALARLPGPGGTTIAPARLAASSLGSWADSMTLAARVERLPLTVDGPVALARGLRFPDRDGVAIGDLLDIADADGGTRRLARVVRREGADVLAVWAGAFAVASTGPVQTLTVAGVNATFHPGDTAALIAEQPLTVEPGGWLALSAGSDTLWLRVDRQDGLSFRGPAWRLVTPALPVGPFTARRLQVAILARLGASGTVSTGLGSGILEPLSVATLVDDDSFYDDPAQSAARPRPLFAAPAPARAAIREALAAAGGLAAISARFGTAAGTAAEAELLAVGWLPIGLGSGFGAGDPPLPATRAALARDGLSRNDAPLHLDPALADLPTSAVIPRAQALRDLEGRALLGLHAALNSDEDPYDAPSLMALPDAAQPSWELRLATGPIAPPRPGDSRPSPTTTERRFRDCDRRTIATPTLTAPAVFSGESFTLSWTAGESGTRFVLDESPRADFAAAAQLWRGTSTRFLVVGRPEGIYYYRLRAEVGADVSSYAAVGVTVQRSAYVVTGPDVTRLARLHVALLRFAAGSGNSFALLSLPQGWRAGEAASYARTLATTAPGFGEPGRLGDAERRSLSFGAIQHPWLVSGGSLATCPDGALAGSMAARARRDGAWAAPANQALVGVTGLDPSLSLADVQRLEEARVNSIRATPRGLMVLAAMTLSGEAEWQQISTRRLLILLRRALARAGAVHVFEPDNGVTRRAVTRSLTTLLDQLQRRGAFAGASSAQSFRIAEAQPADEEDGRLSIDIGVAPATPLRFLNIRLARRGAALAVSEAM